jgi:two-component system chemotaxis response regulator CheY
MTFLIVEDSRTARNMIKNLIFEMKIGKAGRFFEAESGESSLEILLKYDIDFIFMDWNLATEMTGIDVIKMVRKMDKYKKIPILMISSENDKFHVVESLKIGANDFIVKPIDQKSFSEKVLKLAALIEPVD